MKNKCRILSIFVVSVLAVFLTICIAMIKNKKYNEEKIVYAETINFITLAGGIEIYEENELIISNDFVKVSPSDCTFFPSFSITKSGYEEEYINTGRYTFSSCGKYTLKCSIKSNKNYYIHDSIVINVVDNPLSTTAMYIQKQPSLIRYVDDSVSLSSLVNMVYPVDSKVEIACNENVDLVNGNIVMLKEGVGSIDIFLTYENISICKNISFVIKPSLSESGVTLVLTYNGNIVENNRLEIAYSTLSISLSYELVNLYNNQFIECWTNSDIIEIVSYDAPLIVINALDVGEAIVYVRAEAFPEKVFEIVITII